MKTKNHSSSTGNTFFIKMRKLKKEKVLIFSVCIIALLLVLTLLFFPKKTVIAFYNIPSTTREAILGLINDPSFADKNDFNISTLNEKKALKEQMNEFDKVDILFAIDGKAALDIAEKTIRPSEKILQLMPSSIRKAGQDQNRVYGMPLLLDHFEIAYNFKLLNQNGISEPKTISELLTAANKLKKKSFYPIVCAGGEDSDLIQLVGALLEARYGIAAWQTSSNQLKKIDSIKNILTDTNFRAVLDELITWRNSGLIHPEWFRMTHDDVSSFMENEYTGIVFMNLSTHRTIPQRTIEKFSSTFIPPNSLGQERALTAPILIGILPEKNQPNKKAEEFLYKLVQDAAQKKLGNMTGLAPSNSTAETKDKQASDVRLWLASTQKPLQDLRIACFDNSETQIEFAKFIREYIQAGGVGY